MTRAGIAAWCVLGLLGLGFVTFLLASELSLVLAPLFVALFPVALLDPLAVRLRRRLPPALAASILVAATLAALAGLLALIGWLLVAELDELGEALRESYDEIRDLLRDSPLGLDPGPAEDLWQKVQDWAANGGGLVANAREWIVTAVEGAAAALLFVIASWFYLKDGDRMVNWAQGRVPSTWRADATEMVRRGWHTFGGYFRGQILVAAVDAIGIGIGLVLLGVPLAGPLAVLVFFGGFFPIVGATVTGLLAVLVAFAHDGVGLALAVLVLVIAVQQLEGNLLEPVIVGRSIRLHPFIVLLSVTSGAITFGIFGAFVAVPLVASVIRAVEYLDERERPGQPS